MAYLVLGLARSGMATVTWLRQRGETVFVSDSNQELCAQAEALGAIPCLEPDWSTITTLVQSPGIPPSHPLTQAAKAHGVTVCTDISLLRQAAPNATFIGITGTNGKSTTTSLITHVLRAAGLHAEMGGNIGLPALSLDITAPYYVLELSSYQLELSPPLDLSLAVLLNITEDHLERHGTMDAYIQAKMRIFMDNPDTLCVICPDDPVTQACHDQLYQQNRRVIKAQGSFHVPTLAGQHNQQNAAAAFAVCSSLGLSPETILNAFATFPGLPHRQEEVRVLNGVRFINDSKATSGESAAKALALYDHIYWIAGGKAKSDGLTPTLPFLSGVRHVFLIGDAQEAFARQVPAPIPCDKVGDLATATQRAYALAKEEGHPHPVALLSPACASFDQFRDFEHRGDTFKSIVQSL